MTESRSHVARAFIITLACVAVAGLAGAADVARVDVGPTTAVWSAAVESDGLTVTLRGPDGEVRTATAGPGEQVQIVLATDDAPAADGLYVWESRLTPKLDAAAKARIESQRATPELRGLDQETKAAGSLSEAPLVGSGTFRIEGGAVVDGALVEQPAAAAADAAPVTDATPAQGDSDIPGAQTKQVITGDLTVYNSMCVGFDCATSESYGADTIRLKENNLRIHFEDTSTAGSFPSTDWRIEANSNLNGGASYLAFVDASSNRTPFRVEGNAPTNALVVENDGDVGIGTLNPVVRAHLADGDTPTLRLEQNTSSGFAAQTWDVAGNETSFFVRDATNGSTLPFRIRPGASSNALVIDTDDDVGVGILSPNSALHVRRTDGTAKVLVEEASSTVGNRELLELTNNGDVRMTWTDTSAGGAFWRLSAEASASKFVITRSGTSVAELELTEDGDLTVQGDINSVGTTVVPDYVFQPGYELMPMSELAEFLKQRSHLPGVPSAADIARDGLSLNQFQMVLLKKIEELTLYTLEQQSEIERLRGEVANLTSQSTGN